MTLATVCVAAALFAMPLRNRSMGKRANLYHAFSANEEDVEFRIGAPGLPIVATAPEATMIFGDGNR